MVIAVRAEEGPQGLQVVKSCTEPEDQERLAHEAEMLRRGAHPGVVEILDESPGTLVLRHHGTALSGLGLLPVDQAAGVVTAVADVAESLHRQGIAHGRITPEHVVVDEHGRPRLCGFGDAVEITPEAAAADVADLGRLLDGLLDSGAGIAWHPPGPRMTRARRAKQAEHELRAVAASAQREEAARRPTARQFAKSVHTALPSLTLPAARGRPPSDAGGPGTFSQIPDDVDPTAALEWSDEDLSFLAMDDDDSAEFESEPATDRNSGDDDGDADDTATTSFQRVDRDLLAAAPGWSWRRFGWAPVPLLAVVVMLLAGTVVGAAVARSARPFGAEPVTTLADAAGSTPSAEGPATGAATSGARTDPSPPADCDHTGPVGPDTDHDGCPDAVSVEERIATIGAQQVELGADGDLVALGDWDCDGVDTPALLRPSTGEVFVFPSWTLDGPATVTGTAVVPGARAIETTNAPCPEPVVVTGDGRRHRLQLS